MNMDSNSNMDNDIFKKNVIVILSDSLEGDSNKINIQDYIVNGKSFIPVFTSIEKFDKSTQGQVKNDKVEIKGIFLLSILKGNELLKVNPGLENEQEYNADKLIKKYSSEITEMNAEIEKLKKD